MTDLRPPADSLECAVTRILIGYNSANVLGYSHIGKDALPTILVDNASRDNTLAEAKALGYQTIEMGYNAGYARAVNEGLRAAKTEFALIANPDLKIDIADIAKLKDAAEIYREADIFVPRIFDPKGKEFFRCEGRFEPRVRHRQAPEGDACIGIISGAVLLVRRAQFLEAGAFDENIFLFFEDDDIALRWRADRRPIVFISAARAEHLGSRSSTPSEATSRIKDRSFGWSWAYLIRKHAKGSLAGAVTTTAAKCLAHTLTLDTRKARRDVQIVRGLLSAARGHEAPFPK